MMPNSKRKQEDELEYGAVLVTGGRHKEKIGYYDDDEEEMAVVYFGTPLLSEPVIINHKFLKNIENPFHELFKEKNPDFCSTLGIA